MPRFPWRCRDRKGVFRCQRNVSALAWKQQAIELVLLQRLAGRGGSVAAVEADEAGAIDL